MAIIDLSLQDALRAHKQNLAVLDQQAEEARRPAGYVAEVPFEITGDFMESCPKCDNLKPISERCLICPDECTADLDSPCDCSRCQEYKRDSMAYAMADYKPKVVRFGDAEHGDELCDNALCACHDDCDRRDCDICFDHAVGQAEAAFEGER